MQRHFMQLQGLVSTQFDNFTRQQYLNAVNLGGIA